MLGFLSWSFHSERYKQKPLIVLLNALITVISGPNGTTLVVVLMKEILHHLIGSYSSLSVYWLCFEYSMHPRCCRNSTLNNSILCLAGSLRCQKMSNSDKFRSRLGRGVGALNHRFFGSVGFLWFSDISSLIEFIEPSTTQNIWDTGVQNKWILGTYIFEVNPVPANSSIISLQNMFLKAFSANFGRLIKRIGVKYLWTMVQK